MDRNVNQVHHGSGDNIAGDKNITNTKEKKGYKKEIVISVAAGVILAFILGLLKWYDIFPFDE